MRKKLHAVLLSGALAALVLAPLPSVADVADGGGGGYAAWSLDGSSGGYSGTMNLGGGFPDATFTSNSSQATLPGGSSSFLPAGSAPGQVFGSSSGNAYLNQRPKGNSAGAPAITTYTFESPTPAGGWGFVLGDIDADKARVSATGADGQPVAIKDLGFQGVFNYCDAPSPRSCADDPLGFDLPVWDGSTGTLSGSGRLPNADTAGASGWFRPTVPLKSLTIEFTWVTGFPVYQTWFASTAADISGMVKGCTVGGVGLELRGPGGNVVATTVTDSTGAYTFKDFLRVPGYTVTLSTPLGCTPVGPTEKTVDLHNGSVTEVDFELEVPVTTPPVTTPPVTTPPVTTPPVTTPPVTTPPATTPPVTTPPVTTPPVTPSTDPGPTETTTGTAVPSPSSSTTTATGQPVAGSGNLPNTGAGNVVSGVLWSVLLLGAGSLTVLLTRRKGRHQASRR